MLGALEWVVQASSICEVARTHPVTLVDGSRGRE